MSAPTLLARADGSVAIGTGHVMRCLGLAQAWQDAGGAVVFAMVQPWPTLVQRLEAEGITVVGMSAESGSVHDAAQFAELAKSHLATWVVVDGYQFKPDFQRSLKGAGLKVLFIDDNGEGGTYYSDIVLNQNLYASEDSYIRRESYTRLLLGSRYAMLRREFTRWRGWKRRISGSGNKVLVSMGGSDAGNLSEKVIDALGMLDSSEIEARVIVGSSNPHLTALQCAVSRCGRVIEIHQNPSNIPELMAWADVAISAAGSTCWELCFFGLPSLLMDVAENQRGIARSLEERGVAEYLGFGAEVSPAQIAGGLKKLLLSPEPRAAMSQRSQQLVDGRGAERVVAVLRGSSVRLRRAEEADCLLLWKWSNEPEVRAVSFSSEPIPWTDHERWFVERLGDPNSLLYVALDSGDRAIGQVRFQLKDGHAIVSIVLASEFRGQGYGKIVLAKAQEEVFASAGVTCIDAYVKPDNEASLRLFAEAGFKQGRAVAVRGHEAIHFVAERNR